MEMIQFSLKMKRVLMGILMLLNGFEVGRTSNTQSLFQPGNFDTYVMSMSYMPYFCSIASHRSREECQTKASTWLIHGLWPNFSEKYRKQYNISELWPEFCTPYDKCNTRFNISSSCTKIPLQECRDVMGSIWCDELGVHEWIRHGSCTGLSHLSFYKQMQKSGYSPRLWDISQKLVHNSMLKKYTRKNGHFVCDNQCELAEYRECYTKNESNEVGEPVQCESDNSSCTTSCEWIWIE